MMTWRRCIVDSYTDESLWLCIRVLHYINYSFIVFHVQMSMLKSVCTLAFRVFFLYTEKSKKPDNFSQISYETVTKECMLYEINPCMLLLKTLFKEMHMLRCDATTILARNLQILLKQYTIYVKY